MTRAIRIVDELNFVQEPADLFMAYGGQAYRIAEVYVADDGFSHQCYPTTDVSEVGIVMDAETVESYAVDDFLARAVCNWDARTGQVILSGQTFQAIIPPPRAKGQYLYRFEIVSGDIVSHFAAGGSVPDLLTNLVSMYELEEASGDRIDAHGSNDCGPFNAPGSATGVVGDCLDCATNQTVFISSAPAEIAGGDKNFSLYGFVKFDTIPDAFTTIWWNATSLSNVAQYSYGINVNGSKLRFVLSDGSSFYTASADTFGTITTGTWYFFACGYDADNDEAWISINAGTRDVLASVPTVNSGTGRLFVQGCDVSGFRHDGQLDQTGFYAGVLSQEQIEWLYNGGSGRAYADYSSGGSDWYDVLEESTVGVFENYLQNASPGTVVGEATLSFAEDDGAGNPLAGTEVSKTVNFTAQVLSQSLYMSSEPWNLSNTEVNETAEVFVLTVPEGWYDPANMYNVPNAFINGEYGYPKGIQLSEIYALEWTAQITVQVDVVSGAVQGEATGVPLSTDVRRIWYIAAETVGSVEAVIDVTIANGPDSVTKRVTMRAEQLEETAETGSTVDTEFTRYDQIVDLVNGTPPVLAEAEIQIRPDGYVYAFTEEEPDPNGFPQKWNANAGSLTDPENFEARLTVLSGDVPSAGSDTIGLWLNLSTQRAWRYTNALATANESELISGELQLEVREVGRPSTVQTKRFFMSALADTT